MPKVVRTVRFQEPVKTVRKKQNLSNGRYDRTELRTQLLCVEMVDLVVGQESKSHTPKKTGYIESLAKIGQLKRF